MKILEPLYDAVTFIMLAFHSLFKSVRVDPSSGLAWGGAIVGLVVVIRILLIPLFVKQINAQRGLQMLQPEMKKLQERFKNDKERMNQEMMKFYRENKVNPFASCLPMVAQFPVFISLYYMLRIDLRYDICPTVNPVTSNNPQPCGSTPASQFLFIDDLTSKATGSTLIILIVLYVGSQLFSTLLMSTTTDKTQRMIFLALPFVFVTFVIQFPAGLLVYWITTNVWTIVQQAIIRKRLGPLRPVGADTGSPLSGLFGGGGGSSGSNGPKSADTGGAEKAATRVKQPAKVGGAEPKGRPSGPPPASPRKKKKRSGRRR